jgi:hypothetical protein
MLLLFRLDGRAEESTRGTQLLTSHSKSTNVNIMTEWRVYALRTFGRPVSWNNESELISVL